MRDLIHRFLAWLRPEEATPPARPVSTYELTERLRAQHAADNITAPARPRRYSGTLPPRTYAAGGIIPPYASAPDSASVYLSTGGAYSSPSDCGSSSSGDGGAGCSS